MHSESHYIYLTYLLGFEMLSSQGVHILVCQWLSQLLHHFFHFNTLSETINKQTRYSHHILKVQNHFRFTETTATKWKEHFLPIGRCSGTVLPGKHSEASQWRGGNNDANNVQHDVRHEVQHDVRHDVQPLCMVYTMSCVPLNRNLNLAHKGEHSESRGHFNFRNYYWKVQRLFHLQIFTKKILHNSAQSTFFIPLNVS